MDLLDPGHGRHAVALSQHRQGFEHVHPIGVQAIEGGPFRGREDAAALVAPIALLPLACPSVLDDVCACLSIDRAVLVGADPRLVLHPLLQLTS